jgi:ribulose-5-phosphate 4-epimerase/fuculose-1-phosphate aldolase
MKTIIAIIALAVAMPAAAAQYTGKKFKITITKTDQGRVVEGRHAVNRAGFVLHAAVHEAHPEIVAMCHAHTLYGTAFASLGRPLEPISQDAAAFFEDHAVIRSEAGQVAVEERAGKDYGPDLLMTTRAIRREY